MRKARLAIGVSMALSVTALNAFAQSDSENIEVLEIRGASTNTDSRTLSDVENGRIYAGKKTSIVDVEALPTFIEPNLRQMFSQLPGLFVSEQKIPSIFNVNYRGLGDPHESEFVAFYQNNVPLAANLFGYPTMYYMPGAQRIERLEFVRGGSGLLFGPQIGPLINVITRSPSAKTDTQVITEHAFGSDALYSTYNEARWSSGDVGYMVSFDHRQADGPRNNEDFDVSSGYVGVSYEGIENVKITGNLDIYRSDSGEAGRLSSAEFFANRDLVKTPFNRVDIEQTLASLSYEQQLNTTSTLHGNIWYLAMDRLSRRSAAFVAPATEPASTAIDEQQFRNLGYDLRYSTSWGENHILTAGTSGYRGDSPRSQHVSADIRSSAQRDSDLRFAQERLITYNAFFIENLFRLGHLSVSPAVRFERVNYDLSERVKNPSLNRDAINLDRTYNQALFGLGLSYNLSGQSELYFNVSESYRPQRFDDLINPTSELAGSNAPNISKAMNYEMGYRGAITPRLAVDVSLFRIDFKDKIEQIQVNISDIERINSGDSRHQGLELGLEYDFDFLSSQTLTAFANGTWLDTEITTSQNSQLIGNKVSFAPDYLVRAGLAYSHESLKATFTITAVGEQYWQDSNLPRGSADNLIEAKIPAYQVLDLSTEYELTQQWAMFAGINNLLNENYYSRVRTDGIEPAPERSVYLGIRFSL
ncbi:MAG: TonB-dependent receptor [Alishewanella sp. 32-51-5]|nr:MAG: TonB-dependent receptor [Alishewanella sp. 32-51-5]